MKLPFTLKNKRRNTNLKFDFLKLPFWTTDKVHFWFLKKTPLKNVFFVFWLWFSFKNNRRTNVLLVVILKTHKKSYWPSKTPFWLFLAVNNGFLCVFKHSDQNNICVSIVLKAKTEKIKKKKLVDSQKRAFLSFEIKTVKKIVLLIFLLFFL